MPDDVGDFQESAPKLPEQRAVVTPPIDIYETDDGLVLLADVPGVNVETLELQVQDNRLIILGKLAVTIPEEGAARHREFEAGDFLRSFILSDEVDHDRISAKLNNGVLEIVLPKSAPTEPRKIHVEGS